MSRPWVRCSRENQVADRRAAPDEEGAADSSVVTGGRDPSDDFIVPLDDPNEEITEQWQDGLHDWYICRYDQCSVEPSRISHDVSQKRGYLRFCSCVKRRFVSACTNSQISTPRECDSHSAAGDVGVVFSQKPSVVAWFQSCFRVSHLFGLPAPRKVDSSNRTHIPAISGVEAKGSSVVGKIATTTRMMCWYLLMVGISFCLDRVLHAPSGADACSTSSSFVDTFHVDPWNSRDSVEQLVQRRVRRNRVDLVQLGGQMTNPKDKNTAVKLRGYKILHVQQHRLATVSDRARWRATLEESWRPMTLAVIVQNKKSQSLLAYVADLALDQHRRGGRAFLTLNWNVLTTWPIQSVVSEAFFLCARGGKKGILTNCADTARLVGRSRYCKSFMSQRLVQSSLANLFVSHEVCLWNVSILGRYSCNPLDDEETTAFPSEEDESMREWRQEFPEKMRRAIIRIHTNLGHPQNSTLAKMTSDAGGCEEMITCATRYPCSVCKRMSRPRLRRPVSVPRTQQFNDTLLADVHFWNFRGREVWAFSILMRRPVFTSLKFRPHN